MDPVISHGYGGNRLNNVEDRKKIYGYHEITFNDSRMVSRGTYYEKPAPIKGKALKHKKSTAIIIYDKQEKVFFEAISPTEFSKTINSKGEYVRRAITTGKLVGSRYYIKYLDSNYSKDKMIKEAESTNKTVAHTFPVARFDIETKEIVLFENINQVCEEHHTFHGYVVQIVTLKKVFVKQYYLLDASNGIEAVKEELRKDGKM